MLPDKSDKRWKQLVRGDFNHQFKSVPAGMCVARNIRAIQQNEQSIEQSVEEVYTFFSKYEPILQDDISAVFG